MQGLVAISIYLETPYTNTLHLLENSIAQTIFIQNFQNRSALALGTFDDSPGKRCMPSQYLQTRVPHVLTSDLLNDKLHGIVSKPE